MPEDEIESGAEHTTKDCYDDTPRMSFTQAELDVLLNNARRHVVEQLLNKLCIGCAYLEGTACTNKMICPCQVGQLLVVQTANSVLGGSEE